MYVVCSPLHQLLLSKYLSVSIVHISDGAIQATNQIMLLCFYMVATSGAGIRFEGGGTQQNVIRVIKISH